MRVVLALLVLIAGLTGCAAKPNTANPAAGVAEPARLMRELVHSEAYIAAEYGGEVALNGGGELQVLLKIPPNSMPESGAVRLTEMELLPGIEMEGLLSAFAVNLPRESVSTETSVKIVVPSGEPVLGRAVAPMAIVPMQRGKRQAFSRTTLLPHPNGVEVTGEITAGGIFLLVRGPGMIMTWPRVIQVGVGEAWPSIVVGQGESLGLTKPNRLRFQSSGAVSGGGVEQIEREQGGHVFVRQPTKERRFVCVEEGAGEVAVSTEADWRIGSIEGYGPWDVTATVGTKTAVVCQGEKGNKTLALTYESLRIPFQEIYLADPDACPGPHWHSIGAAATTVAGQEVADPNRNGCGFGSALGANWELVPISKTSSK